MLGLASCEKDEPAPIEPVSESESATDSTATVDSSNTMEPSGYGATDSPVIRDFFPKTVTSRDTITILGKHFGSAVKPVQVLIDGQSATVVAARDTILLALAPSVFQATPITVFVRRKEAVSEENLQFILTPKTYAQGYVTSTGISFIFRETQLGALAELISTTETEKDFVLNHVKFSQCRDVPETEGFVVVLDCGKDLSTGRPGDYSGSRAWKTFLMKVVVDTANRVFRSVHVESGNFYVANSSNNPNSRHNLWRLVATNIPYMEHEGRVLSSEIYGTDIESALEDFVVSYDDITKGGPYIRSAVYGNVVERKPIKPDAVLKIELRP